LVDRLDPFQLIIGLAGDGFKVTTTARDPVLHPTELTTESVYEPASEAVNVALDAPTTKTLFLYHWFPVAALLLNTTEDPKQNVVADAGVIIGTEGTAG